MDECKPLPRTMAQGAGDDAMCVSEKFAAIRPAPPAPRGLHSSTSQLNLSRV